MFMCKSYCCLCLFHNFAEVRSTETSLTLDQIREKAKKLNVEISEMETKLSVLRQGTVLVTPEERKQVEEAYNLKFGMWRKRKNMFRDLWVTITEAMTEDSKQASVHLRSRL
jgi:26S proteasome regulatory subunit (ATPase 3-interacting protein)